MNEKTPSTQDNGNHLVKLSLPITILISSIILGGFLYAIQVNKQSSIEKQQELKLEQDNREYISKRKDSCFSVYEKESDKWDNTVGFRYFEKTDNCTIQYKTKESGSKEDCKYLYEAVNQSNLSFEEKNSLMAMYSECLRGIISEIF